MVRLMLTAQDWYSRHYFVFDPEHVPPWLLPGIRLSVIDYPSVLKSFQRCFLQMVRRIEEEAAPAEKAWTGRERPPFLQEVPDVIK